MDTDTEWGPWTFGTTTLTKGDAAVYCPGFGFAYRATCTDVSEGRVYHYAVFPDGHDLGSGSWHSELHSPDQFLERARTGGLGPAVQAAADQGGDLDAVLARLEPATRDTEEQQ